MILVMLQHYNICKSNNWCEIPLFAKLTYNTLDFCSHGSDLVEFYNGVFVVMLYCDCFSPNCKRIKLLLHVPVSVLTVH